jgi:hypothetical protein
MDAAGCVRSVPFPDLQQHRATSVTPACLPGAVGWLPGTRRPGQARSAALFQLATGLPAVVLPACRRRSRGILSAFRGPPAVAPACACLPHPAGSGPCGKLGEER